MRTIIVSANGPSAYSKESHGVINSLDMINSKVFRTNYFFLNDGDPLKYKVTDWFICEDVSDCRAVRAAIRFSLPMNNLTIWMPGIDMKKITEIDSNHLKGFNLRLQCLFKNLPIDCRWEQDLRPERPLMGSLAIAIAVGMNPDTIILTGHDLFQHPSGTTHAGTDKQTRDWQDGFNKEYLTNTHRNHRLTGDLKYIENALKEYKGNVISCGTVLKRYFEFKFPQWTWLEG